jgi:hypothetical protein
MGGESAFDPIENQTVPVGSSRHSGRVDDIPGLSPLLPRVYIVSETRLFREGLMAMMIREGRLDVVGHGSGREALHGARCWVG